MRRKVRSRRKKIGEWELEREAATIREDRGGSGISPRARAEAQARAREGAKRRPWVLDQRKRRVVAEFPTRKAARRWIRDQPEGKARYRVIWRPSEQP